MEENKFMFRRVSKGFAFGPLLVKLAPYLITAAGAAWEFFKETVPDIPTLISLLKYLFWVFSGMMILAIFGGFINCHLSQALAIVGEVFVKIWSLMPITYRMLQMLLLFWLIKAISGKLSDAYMTFRT